MSMLSAYKISEMQCKGNIFKFGTEQAGVGKCAFFSTENWLYVAFSDEIKIIKLE